MREHTILFSSMLDEVTKVILVKENINKEKIFQDFHKLHIGNLGQNFSVHGTVSW